ncbi:MarR family winged helix-turn-helix transcriptional regulator [Microbacterium sp. NPDC096154]|uniref:MarR family winged helix-turn-helix transcriptional regulator n=1 Tax=Microbacterium sp. NPDC096154 TaxID=3155549 RepID=UPI0033178145
MVDQRDPASQIAEALGRLRGPWAPGMRGAGPFGAGPFGGGPFGGDSFGGPRGFAAHGHGHGHGHAGDHGHGGHGDHGHGDDDHGHGHGHGHGDHGRGGRGPLGRGMARLRLLESLATAGSAQSVGALADALGVDQPRASRLVQGAVEAGLARREADPSDARRTLVALTGEGRAIVDRSRGARADAVSQALENFTPAEREQLAILLTRLADAWPR